MAIHIPTALAEARSGIIGTVAEKVATVQDVLNSTAKQEQPA